MQCLVHYCSYQVNTKLSLSIFKLKLSARSGASAQLIAKYRPRCPIYAITRFEQAARQVQTMSNF